MTRYAVNVSNVFDTDSPEDAVAAMIDWLAEAAPHTAYLVTDIDADPESVTLVEADELGDD